MQDHHFRMHGRAAAASATLVAKLAREPDEDAMFDHPHISSDFDSISSDFEISEFHEGSRAQPGCGGCCGPGEIVEQLGEDLETATSAGCVIS